MNLKGECNFKPYSYLVLYTRISQRNWNVSLWPLLRCSLVLKDFVRVGPFANTMEVLCLLGWLAGLPQGRAHKHLFLAFSWTSKCTKAKTPVCTPLSWQTTPKHPEFLWRTPEREMHPTFPINRKPSGVGWRKTTTMLEHTALDRLEDSKLLSASLVDLQNSCLARASMQIHQQNLGDP